MANILSLALKINADASGLKLDPVQRALVNLGNEADKLNGAFAKFAGSSEAAARAQEKTAAQSQALINGLRDGTISSTQFAAQFERLTESVNAEAAAFERAARITEQNLTQFERFERQAAELREQVEAGRITQDTYNRALEGAAKGLTDAERAAAGLAVKTKEVADAGDRSKLRFNELSGIFSALPGPLGNIAGRISGITSATEGLSRVFSGGSGLTVAVGAAAAGLTAFTAASAVIARGLIQLEDRVENLGNIADKLGVSFGFIQTLEEAARRSGTSIDAVSGAFGRLQKSVLGVDEESKAAQQSLLQLGITAEQIQQLKPEEQYRLIGERIAAIDDPARRTAAAIGLFGRAGADLLPFFRNLGGAADDLRQVGAVLTDRQRRDIDNFGAALDRLGVAATSAGRQLYAAFADTGRVIANSLAEATGAAAKFIEEWSRLDKINSEFAKLRREIISVQAGPITDAQRAAIAAGQTAEQVLAAARGEVVELKDALEEPPDPALEKYFDELSARVEKAKQESVQFGQAGFDAALEFENSVKTLRDQLGKGFFNATTFRQQAETAGVAFKSELDRIQQDATLDLQIDSDAEQTLAGVNKAISDAIEKASQFGQDGSAAAIQFQNRLRDVASQFERQQINAATVRLEIEKATELFDRQVRSLETVRDLLGQTADIERQLTDVQFQQEQVRLRLNEARSSSNKIEANAASNRLAQLDQLEARLQEQLQALDQGFGDGFDAAFEKAARSFDGLIQKAGQFGNAGATAAQEIQSGIANAQQQALRGIFNAPAFQAEVDRQRVLLTKRLDDLEAVRQREFQVQKDIFDAKVQAANRVDAFLKQQIDGRKEAELDADLAVQQRKRESLLNVQALQEQLDVQRKALAAAREAGDLDLQAARAAQQRIKGLQDAIKGEQAIADGRFKAQAQLQQQVLSDQRTAAEQQAQLQEQLAQAQEQQQQQRENVLNEITARRQQQFERDVQRIQELNTLGPRAIQGIDLRTRQGADLVLGLELNRQDPALIEQRIQTRILQQIAENLIENTVRNINAPVSIVGSARLN